MSDTYDPNTVKSVLSIFQKEFEAEEGRSKHIISKVQMMLTIAGILLAAITFLIKTIIENKWLIALNVPIAVIAGILVVLSISIFLNVIKIKVFRRIKIVELSNTSELLKNVTEVEARLIATYEDALNANREVVDDMVEKFKKGTTIIQVATSIILAVLIVIFAMTLLNAIGR